MKEQPNKLKAVRRKWKLVDKLYRKLIFLPYMNRKTWNFNYSGINLVFDTSNDYSRRWFYPRYRWNRIHEPITSQVFLELIKPKDIVFDVGAHLGYFTCLAATLANKGKVFAFDTDLKSCKLVAENAKLNKLKNIYVQHRAISSSSGVVKIPNWENPDPGLIIGSVGLENSVEVKCISIDEFIIENKLKPNFIKIDIEGAEILALKGMHQTMQLENLTMLVEVHVKQLKKHFCTDYSEVIKLILDNNFLIENIDHRLNGGVYKKVDMNSVLSDNSMLLCTKAQSKM